MTSRRKDAFPQILSVDVTQTTADFNITLQIPLPVARVPGTRKVTVFEILKIQFTMVNSNALPLSANTSFFGALATASVVTPGIASTNAQVQATIRDPRTFAHCWNITEFLTSGSFNTTFPIEYTFEDSAGRGILIGTDSIFLHNQSIASTAVVSVFAKIFYRFVDVSPIEFIGIVQSQQ